MLLLFSFCAATLLTGGAWLINGCAQAGNAQGNQARQTRPRRSGLEIKKTDPRAGKTGEATGQSAQPGDKNGDKAPSPFYAALETAGINLQDGCALDDPVARRVLEDYGAMFVATDQVMPPPVCMFDDEAGVSKFQNDAKFKAAVIGGTKIELQPVAMEALLAARSEANEQGLDITPRGGTTAARRSYQDTQRLWDSRFLPALTHWQGQGRLTREQAERLRRLPIHDQVREVLELEKRGIFFSQDLSKSILYSVAAPGASQHISMLALDVSQFGNARVRGILARHGWFQTVKSDLPHFTFLGLDEKELPARGLRTVKVGAQIFWIPNVSPVVD